MALKYRLCLLGWYNFEVLVQLLLKAMIGPGVTAFGGTKDGGRDATFEGVACFPSSETRWSGMWWFQAKHTDIEGANSTAACRRASSAFAKEVAAIKKRHRRRPDNYVFVTSVPLTASCRESLEGTIRDAGYAGNFASIDGREVCQFLDLFPDVRRSFPQLIGLADIDMIINRDLYERSRAFVSNIQPQLVTFVATEPYFKARQVLREHHFVVLDGPPEHGKTFVGAAITLSRACEGFQVFDLRRPNEVFRGYDATAKQVYFADDAVGAIEFNPHVGDQWSRDLPCILRKLDSRHKLVWTSRSYILQEAIDRTKLREQIEGFPGIHEVLVEVSALTEIEKALILYNHAKHARLRGTAKNFIKRNATTIVNHENYTPERVRQLFLLLVPEITGRSSRKKEREWDSNLQSFMDNPSERYERVYKEALGSSERLLLMLLLSMGGEADSKHLCEEYERALVAL